MDGPPEEFRTIRSNIEGELEWERKARRMAYLCYSLGAAALGGIISARVLIAGNVLLIGFGVTAYSVYRMMKSQQAGDGIGCVRWQRVRVVSTALSISLLSLPMIVPSLSNSSVLFRTTRTIT